MGAGHRSFLGAPAGMTITGALRRRYRYSLATALSWKTIVTEVIGVAAFVFIGCGSAALVTAPTEFIVQKDVNSNFNTLFVGIAFGAAIFVAISATAHNNSDQLNPAVSIALMAAGTCPLLQVRALDAPFSSLSAATLVRTV